MRYFNDSKCTTPEGAIVALASFPPRSAVMIVGGYDKHVSFETLGAALAENAKAVVTVGATSPSDRRGRRRRPGSVRSARPAVLPAESFDQAVELARSAASPGDAVVLSPACASYDMFDNYEQRGRRFVELVNPR